MDPIDRIVTALEGDPRVLFVTGAGVSADSGLPTYRGIGGLYDDAETEEGVPIEVALSGGMFARDPALTWKYIAQIEAAGRGAGPNRAHRVIAAFERRFTHVDTLTQNVDGLHQAGGATRVIPIHGDVHFLRCTACAYRETVSDYAHLSLPPHCPECGAVVRPEVVLFGEMLPSEPVRRLEAVLTRGFDVVFSIGTTSVFPYIAAPIRMARESGALSVEINPGSTQVSRAVDIKLARGAADVLGEIADRLGLDA